MNSTALAVIQPDEMDTIVRAGKMLAASGYFDGKGESNQAVAMMATKIMAGREIGIGPFASVNGIHIISGKPAIGANLMAAALKSSDRYDYRVLELTNAICRIEYRQRMGDKWEVIGISEFTKEDAKNAQTKNMDKFPKNMLFARAMSNGVRFYTPDIFSGNSVYVPEELGAEVDGDGNVVDVTPRSDTRNPTLGVTEYRGREARNELLRDLGEVETKHEGGGSFDATTEQPKGNKAHKYMFGHGLSTFGDDWDAARPWLIEQWTKKHTPDNVRTSSGDLTDQEKTQLGDSMKENGAMLQEYWSKHLAKMQPELAAA